MLRESSYADLTVRAVAARAKVAPATAYTYFSSKNHLIAEVYLDLMQQVPYFTDVNEPMPTRVEKALRSMALAVADEPEVAAACTTALLSGNDPTVRRVRDRIGAEIHRRIRSAVGPDADPRVVVGAGDDVLRRAGQRGQRRLHLPPDRRPPQLRGRPHRRRRYDDRQQQPDVAARPVRLRLPRRPVPVLQAAARRGAAVPQRGARVLGAVAARATSLQGFRNSTTLSNKHGVSLDPVSRSDRTPTRPCRSSPWTIPATCGCARWCPRASRRGESANSSRGSPRSPCSISTSCWSKVGRHVRLRRRLRGQAADGRHLRTDGRARRGPGSGSARWADGVMHREDGVTDVPAAAIEASVNLIVYYQDMVAERRKKPSDDLTSALLEAEIDGDRLTDDEIIGFMFLMVDRRQRDHHETACQRRLLGPQEPRPAGPGLRRPRRGSRCGSRRRCATTRPARSWPAPCPAT